MVWWWHRRETPCLVLSPSTICSSFQHHALVSLTPSQLKSYILLGDFNVDLLLNSQLSSDLTAMLSSFDFTQVVDKPTRLSKYSSSLIDHVYLSDCSMLSSCSTSPPLGTSDHRSILLSLNWSKCPSRKVTHRICNYSRADWDAICTNLETLPTPTDSSWLSWKSHFLEVLSHHIHVPTKVCKVRKTLPWITSDLLKLFCEHDLAFSQFKSTKTERLRTKYQLLWNKSVSDVWKARCEFLQSLSSLIRSPKQFWSLYYSLASNKQRIPPHTEWWHYYCHDFNQQG